MLVQRSVRRAAAVSLTAFALSCSGVAMAHADNGQGQGNPPGHSQAGGKKGGQPTPPQDPGHQGSRGHGGDPGHQGYQGHEGNPGHQGSNGGNQGNPGAPVAPPQGPEHSPHPAQPEPPGDDVNGPGHNPPGNNGTIKIEQLQADGTPQNNPHPGCQLRVEWYGFDEGDDVVSEVSFEAIAPTAGSSISTLGATSVPVGGDPASGAGTDTGLDGSEVYTLSFTGTPHPQQGYHVKVTVHTPHSLGNDSKTKVFWMEPCDDDSSSQTGGAAPQPGAPGAPGMPGGVDVTGTGTDTGSDVTVTATTPTDDASVPVPTSVDAGSEGPGQVEDLLPLGLLGLGAAMTAAAAYLRRRAARA